MSNIKRKYTISEKMWYYTARQNNQDISEEARKHAKKRYKELYNSIRYKGKKSTDY